MLGRSFDVLAVLVTVVFLGALTYASLIGVLDPVKASAAYGMPVNDAAGVLFYRVFASRNLAIIAASVIFLVVREWRALATLVSLTFTLAAFDAGILWSAHRTPPGFHFVALGLIALASALLWRVALAASPSSRPGIGGGVFERALDMLAVLAAVVFVGGLAVVSVFGLMDPIKASTAFGMPINDAAAAFFYRVFVSRNLVIMAASAIFLLTRQWKPLATLVTLAIGLGVFDITVLSLAGRTPPDLHLRGLIFLAVTAVLLWRLARNVGPSALPVPS
jgi:hypothetical protein